MRGRTIDPHAEAARCLDVVGQRYTASRRALVDLLARAGRPLTIPEVLASGDDEAKGMPQSSAYRNLTVLVEAGAVRRLPTANADDHGRYELAEPLAAHHHHLVCTTCGVVADLAASAGVERALDEAAAAARTDLGFVVSGHSIDLQGTCSACLSR